jgi:Lysylphosphatidylglycerol synthase TM region
MRRAGIVTILDSARALGAGFVLLILLSGLRHALRTTAWHASIGRGTPRPGLLNLFGLRLVGEGLNGVTPAGQLLGESVKTLVASKVMPASASASSVVIENIIYGFGAALFMLSGAVWLLVSSSPHARLGDGIVIVCMTASMFVLLGLLRRRAPLAQSLLALMPAKWRLTRSVRRHEDRMIAIETDIHDFFRTRRNAFIVLLGVEFLTNFTGVAEVYLILRVTTLHASLVTSYLVEVANRAVQLFFAFIPFGLGVEEASAAGTLAALGYSAGQGVSLAVLRRARTIFWSGLGLLLAARYWSTRSLEEEGAV